MERGGIGINFFGRQKNLEVANKMANDESHQHQPRQCDNPFPANRRLEKRQQRVGLSSGGGGGGTHDGKLLVGSTFYPLDSPNATAESKY